MKLNSYITALMALGLSATGAQALTLPDIVSDNMMLQQQSEASLWGWAEPGSTVTVAVGWDGRSYSAQAAADGRWDVKVSTPAASYTPYTISIAGDGTTLTLDNVLIGEVWFASGQSNMEMPLGGFWGAPVEGANKAIAEAGRYSRRIRFATVPKSPATTPQQRVAGKWMECTPENAPTFSAAAYFFARQLTDIIDTPVGIINCSWGGSHVEGWMPEDLLRQYADVDLSVAADPDYREWDKPMIMYNGMLRPLAGFTVRGFLWNQGESNIGHHATYPSRFAAMVAHWRQLWAAGELPIYCVEIPPHAYGDVNGTIGALLREAQHKAVGITPRSGIICSADLGAEGAPHQIHPEKKQQVGERLAYMAAVREYGVKGVRCDAPEFESMKVDGNTAILHFSNAVDGFTPERGIEGFEAAGADRVFHPAKAVEVYSSRPDIMVTCDQVDQIVAVRYCFKNYQQGTLYDLRGLPVVPFRTDNWE